MVVKKAQRIRVCIPSQSEIRNTEWIFYFLFSWGKNCRNLCLNLFIQDMFCKTKPCHCFSDEAQQNFYCSLGKLITMSKVLGTKLGSVKNPVELEPENHMLNFRFWSLSATLREFRWHIPGVIVQKFRPPKQLHNTRVFASLCLMQFLIRFTSSVGIAMLLVFCKFVFSACGRIRTGS